MEKEDKTTIIRSLAFRPNADDDDNLYLMHPIQQNSY